MQILFPGQIGIWRVLWRKENRRTRRKILGARQEPATNSTLLRYRTGIEAGPHWWEASALTTAPSLLPR